MLCKALYNSSRLITEVIALKIRDGFILQKIADKYVAVSVNDDDDEPDIVITLNKTGAFMWEIFQEDLSYNEALKKITDHYDVDEKLARADLDKFLSETTKARIIEND